jgi:predicted kinase
MGVHRATGGRFSVKPQYPLGLSALAPWTHHGRVSGLRTIEQTERVLIVMSGLAGSGKTTIASAIGRARRCPALSVDPIESAIVQSGVTRSFETGLGAYLVAATLAEAHLSAGLDVVIDAANYVEPARDLWRALATKHRLALTVIECVVTDPTIHATRLSSRDRGLRIAEPSWQLVEEQGAEWTSWPEPHLRLDALDPIDRNVARAIGYVADQVAASESEGTR